MSALGRYEWLEPLVIPNATRTAWQVPEPALRALASLLGIYEAQRIVYARLAAGDPTARPILDIFCGRLK